MINIEKMQIVRRLYESALKHEAQEIEKFRDPKKRIQAMYGLSWLCVEKFAYEFFVKENHRSSREFLALSAMASLYQLDVLADEEDLLIHPICYAIVSCNEALIMAYARMSLPNGQSDFVAHYIALLQKLILGVKEGRDQHFLLLEKYARRGWERYYRGIIQALHGLDSLDPMGVISGLNEFVNVHESAEESPLLQGLVSLESVMILHLARRLGLAVIFEHPLVPKELVQCDMNSTSHCYPMMQEWAKARGFVE